MDRVRDDKRQINQTKLVQRTGREGESGRDTDGLE